MIARANTCWQSVLDHPILRLELRRIRRRRWWPGRRFFLFYPALLGAALGCGLMAAVTGSPGMKVATLATGLPAVCLLSTVTGLLSFVLPWIVPALTAAAIARERELGTLDLLRTTLLTERSIVLGKLGGCLAQLWPGVLVLALLSPFQIIWVAVGGSFGLSSMAVAGAAIDSRLDAGLLWMWLLLAGVIGWLRPWGDIAFHAAIGLFVSTLARSSGVAVAISYGAVLAARVMFYLVSSIVNIVMATVPVALAGTPEAAMGGLLAIPTLVSLGIVLVEFIGAALLVWGAIRWLRRA